MSLYSYATGGIRLVSAPESFIELLGRDRGARDAAIVHAVPELIWGKVG
jgi:hypothetical protein